MRQPFLAFVRLILLFGSFEKSFNSSHLLKDLAVSVIGGIISNCITALIAGLIDLFRG